MKTVSQIIVSIKLGGEKTKVGELVANGRSIYFKYNPDFLHTNWQISPFKLPDYNGLR